MVNQYFKLFLTEIFVRRSWQLPLKVVFFFASSLISCIKEVFLPIKDLKMKDTDKKIPIFHYIFFIHFYSPKTVIEIGRFFNFFFIYYFLSSQVNILYRVLQMKFLISLYLYCVGIVLMTDIGI